MKRIITVITGKVARDIYGSFADCSPGLYIDSDMVETIFEKFRDRNVKVTIEVIESEINHS